MQATVELPKAFSVRDEHEFFPFQHLMARLNPKILVEQVATGKHVNGGCTVFWGVIYLEGQKPDKIEIESALKQAGFDFHHEAWNQSACMWSDQANGDKDANARHVAK
jgi:hypothetical protein